MPCNEITIGSAYDCTNPLQGGTAERLVVINFDDIEAVIQSGGTITDITMKSGKRGYAFEGFKNSNTPSIEKQSSPSGQATWKHQVSFYIYENTQAAKNNMEKIANGKFVCIIQNAKSDANAFEVFGVGAGVEMVDGPMNNKSENNGAYTITLASGEGLGEARLPQTFGNSFSDGHTKVEIILDPDYEEEPPPEDGDFTFDSTLITFDQTDRTFDET